LGPLPCCSLEELLLPEQRAGKYGALNLRRCLLVLEKYKELDKASRFAGMHKSKQAEVGGCRHGLHARVCAGVGVGVGIWGTSGYLLLMSCALLRVPVTRHLPSRKCATRHQQQGQ
jgi:hypothetical protein